MEIAVLIIIGIVSVAFWGYVCGTPIVKENEDERQERR
jgi:hypothetical protein